MYGRRGNVECRLRKGDDLKKDMKCLSCRPFDPHFVPTWPNTPKISPLDLCMCTKFDPDR